MISETDTGTSEETMMISFQNTNITNGTMVTSRRPMVMTFHTENGLKLFSSVDEIYFESTSTNKKFQPKSEIPSPRWYIKPDTIIENWVLQFDQAPV